MSAIWIQAEGQRAWLNNAKGGHNKLQNNCHQLSHQARPIDLDFLDFLVSGRRRKTVSEAIGKWTPLLNSTTVFGTADSLQLLSACGGCGGLAYQAELGLLLLEII